LGRACECDLSLAGEIAHDLRSQLDLGHHAAAEDAAADPELATDRSPERASHGPILSYQTAPKRVCASSGCTRVEEGEAMSQLDDLLGGLLGGQGGTTGSPSVAAGGQSGGAAASLIPMLLPVLASVLAGGGLNKILDSLKAQGGQSQADSWVGTGTNEPVSAQQVQQAVGEDEIDRIAEKLGVPKDDAAQAVADVLPQVVDKVSPDGQLPPQNELDQAFSRLAQQGAGT
jgi:uncharacterized protein YidB (DUF937 family)